MIEIFGDLMVYDIFKATGDPYEIGLRMGKTYQNILSKGLNLITDLNIIKKSFSKAMLMFLKFYIRKVAKKVRKRVIEYYPEIDEYIKGVAEGASVDPLLIYEINMFENLAGRPKKRARAPEMQCTGVVTKKLVGKNYDYPSEFEDFQIVRIWKFKGRNATMSLAHHILPGTHAGMNEHGLALVYTYVEGRDAEITNVPTTIVLEVMLQNVKTVDDAIEFIKEAPRATGANVLMTDGKRSVVVEYAASKIHVREGDVLVAANHYISDEMQYGNLPEDKTYPVKDFKVPIIISSRKRYERMLQLVKPDMTVEDVMNAFKDHHPEPGDDSICRHGPYWHTLASIIFIPSEKKMYATKGNPCKNPFNEYIFEL